MYFGSPNCPESIFTPGQFFGSFDALGSIEIEHFKRATQQGPFLSELSRLGLKCSSDLARNGVRIVAPKTLQKPVFTLSGCQPICVNTLLCDALGLAEKISSVWIENFTRSIGIELFLFQSQGIRGERSPQTRLQCLQWQRTFETY